MDSYSDIDWEAYFEPVKFVGGLSSLYSDSKIPYVHYRFAERLFCRITNSTDLSRDDNSFDAITTTRTGVGVKTFVAASVKTTKSEKVAEFTSLAASGALDGLSRESLAHTIATERNFRISSNLAEFGLELNGSFYHCLIRVPGGAYVLEEPYSKVVESHIVPTDANGNPISTFSGATSGHVYFSDSVNKYMYNSAKNVLYKRFDPTAGFTTQVFPIDLDQDLFGRWEFSNLPAVNQEEITTALSEDYVVLPLYSTKYETRTVAEKSGINQWNAGGRVRNFGEAYVPIPSDVHRLKPGFFPPRDQNFKLRLPNGKVISAKVCQDNSKALMSSPNTDLCQWLYSTIDGSYQDAQTRLANARPYTYGDLSRIGKDAVRITRVDGDGFDYQLSTANLGAYEDFLSGLEAE